MEVTVTPAAAAVVGRVATTGRRDLMIVLGTGCCDSTAPFLYDRYTRTPDLIEVGRVGAVPVCTYRWLADLYPGTARVTIDVQHANPNDSLSLESEFDCRLVLRPGAPSSPAGADEI